MGFLRRLVGGSGDAHPDAAPVRVVQAHEGTLILAGTACPLCGVDFHPLPVQAGKRRCPACRELVYVARVDDVGYIVRDKASAPQPVVSDDEYLRARGVGELERGIQHPMNRRLLAKWASLGLWVLIEGEAKCGRCRQDLGRSYSAAAAPLLPRSDCKARRFNECFLRYRLVLPPA